LNKRDKKRTATLSGRDLKKVDFWTEVKKEKDSKGVDKEVWIWGGENN